MTANERIEVTSEVTLNSNHVSTVNSNGTNFVVGFSDDCVVNVDAENKSYGEISIDVKKC